MKNGELREKIMRYMSTAFFVSLFVLLGIIVYGWGREAKQYKNIRLHVDDARVGMSMNYLKDNVKSYLTVRKLEETTEYTKYLVYDTYVTVKNDTIVAIWRKR